MNVPKKWLKVLAFSFSLPSTIFAVVIIFKYLESTKLISKNFANIFIILFIIFFLGLLVYYALRQKK